MSSAADETLSEEEKECLISFHDPVWLETFPLTKDTAMDYFALSTFYDKTCNNQQCKMQRLPLESMKQMKGIEYELILSKEPSLFVIRKQVRHSPETVTHTGTYYVLHGSIYASPVVHTVISEQLRRSLFYLKEGFSSLVGKVKFSLGQGANYQWDFGTPEQAKSQPSKPLTKNPRKASEQNSMIDAILTEMNAEEQSRSRQLQGQQISTQ